MKSYLLLLLLLGCGANATSQSEFKHFNIAQEGDSLSVLSKQNKIICSWNSGILNIQSYVASDSKHKSVEQQNFENEISEKNHLFQYGIPQNYFHIYTSSIQTEVDLKSIQSALGEKVSNPNTFIIVYDDVGLSTTRIAEFIKLVGNNNCVLQAFHTNMAPRNTGKLLYYSNNTNFTTRR